MKVNSTTTNQQREIKSQALFRKLLRDQKLTFLFDVDETVTQTHFAKKGDSGKAFELQQKGSFTDCMQLILPNLYPTSLNGVETLESLHDLGQGLGFFSQGNIAAAIKLKASGIDFDKIDFLGFNGTGGLADRDIEFIKEKLDLEGAHLTSVEGIIKALEEKHNLQVVTEFIGFEKWRLMHKLQKMTNESVRELINRPIITIGDKSSDCETLYPESGGLGVALSPNHNRVPSNFTTSLASAVSYGVGELLQSTKGSKLRAQMRKNGTFHEGTVMGTQIKIHELNTLSDTDAVSTWKEIQQGGPLRT